MFHKRYLYMFVKLSLLCSDEGKITVYNVGTKADGEFEDIKGTAEAPNPAAPAALLVTFPIGECMVYKAEKKGLESWLAK
jgi:hypothetical protein